MLRTPHAFARALTTGLEGRYKVSSRENPHGTGIQRKYLPSQSEKCCPGAASSLWNDRLSGKEWQWWQWWQEMSRTCQQTRALGWQSRNSLSRLHPHPLLTLPHTLESLCGGCVLPGFWSHSSSYLPKCLTHFLAQSSCSMYICWMNEEMNMESLNSCYL